VTVAGRAACTRQARSPTHDSPSPTNGLGFLAAGVAIAAVAQLTDQLGLEVRLAAAVLVVCGLACGIGAFSRWMGNERAMRLGEPLPSSPLLLVLTAIVAGAGIVALIIVSFG
jgi:putative membrane protein